MKTTGLRLLLLKVIAVAIMGCWGLGTGLLWGELPPASQYNVSVAEGKIKIDGVLDEAAWETAAKIDLPYETYPGDNTPAVVKTECLVIYSKSKLYLGFRCFDPEPGKIRSHLMDRDAMTTFVQDDQIIILLDTFNDERRAFQFRVNPRGVQADANFSELEGIEDFSWDAIWNSAGKITDFGYVVEVAIPFNQLRFSRTQEKQTWGIGIERRYPRAVSRFMKSYPVDRNRKCILCQMNKITGFQGISPGRNLEFDPTLTLTRTDEQTDYPDGPMETGNLKAKPAIDARWGITPSLIFNATINPDFSQVEADAAQLEMNIRFALRYPEKRPFFLEGADFFATPLEIVFTRTVFDPLWGIKLTGKLNKNALGIFAAQDRSNYLLFPSNQGSYATSLEEDVYSAVLRYRKDVGKGSTLGALYTGRVSDDYYNHVAGLDGFFRLSRTKSLMFQFLHSQTLYPDATARRYGQPDDAFGGNALFAYLSHNGRYIRYYASYKDLSEKFRADYGYMPRVDIRHIDGFLERILWGKRGGWFHKITFFLRGQRITDTHGLLTDQEIKLAANYYGPLQTYFQPSFNLQKEWYNGITYDKKLWRLYGEIRPTGGMTCSLFSQFGDTIDYSNSRLAYTFFIEPTIGFALSKHLNINFDHTFQRLSLNGEKIYTVNLSQVKAVYNVNIRTLFQVILQYMNVQRNTGIYLFPVSPESRTLFTQFLFSYKVNPQTKIYIGYSDDYLGMKNIDLTRTNRTFFLKIGYAFVY